jgi:hypothetical protein
MKYGLGYRTRDVRVLGSLFIRFGREIYLKEEQRKIMEVVDSEGSNTILDHQRTEAARKVGRRGIYINV